MDPLEPGGMLDRVDVLELHDDSREGDEQFCGEGRTVRVGAVVGAGAVLMLRPVLMLG